MERGGTTPPLERFQGFDFPSDMGLNWMVLEEGALVVPTGFEPVSLA